MLTNLASFLSRIEPSALIVMIITGLLTLAAFWWAVRLFRIHRPSRRGGRLDALRNPGLTVLTAALFLAGGVIWQLFAAFAGSGAPPSDGDGEPAGLIRALALDPVTHDTLYVATHLGLWRRPFDRPWERSGKEHFDLAGFTVLPDGSLLASGSPPAPGTDWADPLGVIRSTDQGQTWEVLALPGQAEFQLLSAPQGQVWSTLFGLQIHDREGLAAGLYRSDDGGVTWEAAAAEGLPGDFSKVFALDPDPNRPGRLLAGTAEGLLVSNDSGDTWEQALDFLVGVPVTAVGHLPSRENLILLYVPAVDWGLVVWDETEEVLRSLGLDLGDSDLVLYLAADPGDERLIMAGTLGQNLFVTADGGASWTLWIRQGLLEP